MANRIIKMLNNWFIDWGLSKNTTDFLVVLIIVVFIAVLSILMNYLTKKAIHSILKQIVKRTKNNWDDILFEHRVFHRFSHLAPAIVIYYSAGIFLKHYKIWLGLIHSGIYIYVTIVFMLAFSSFLSALNAIYIKSPGSAHKPIKGYLQVVNIFNYCVGIIIILSIIFDKDPSYFLTGIGAIAAVLLIVFKDSLLGLVAGIQLSANDMVKIGDWISMPSNGADGIVSEISLNTVRIENFDKTITYVPSYALVSESFVNWRGMSMSKARRIMRSLHIDPTTVSFIDDDLANELKKIPLLKSFDFGNISDKKHTNIGIFRKYCELYLREHKLIRQDLTVVSRELQAGSSGLPLELYCFSSETEFGPFESVQSEILEHLMAITPQFRLKLYQNPAVSNIYN